MRYRSLGLRELLGTCKAMRGVCLAAVVFLRAPSFAAMPSPGKTGVVEMETETGAGSFGGTPASTAVDIGGMFSRRRLKYKTATSQFDFVDWAFLGALLVVTELVKAWLSDLVLSKVCGCCRRRAEVGATETALQKMVTGSYAVKDSQITHLQADCRRFHKTSVVIQKAVCGTCQDEFAKALRAHTAASRGE